jgi:hypothetical protein
MGLLTLLLSKGIIEYFLIFLVLVGYVFVKIIAYTYDYYKNKNKNENPTSNTHHPSTIGERVGSDLYIYKELSRILFSACASRVSILNFHNGQVFSTSTPIWKFSKTYEVCENGIKPEVDSTQNIMITHMTQLLTPIFAGDINIKGIDKIADSTEFPDIHINNFRVYRLKQEHINHFYISSFLLNRAILEMVYCPIFDKELNVVGLLCLEYCLERTLDYVLEHEKEVLIKDIFSTAAKISEKM